MLRYHSQSHRHPENHTLRLFSNTSTSKSLIRSIALMILQDLSLANMAHITSLVARPPQSRLLCADATPASLVKLNPCPILANSDRKRKVTSFQLRQILGRCVTGAVTMFKRYTQRRQRTVTRCTHLQLHYLPAHIRQQYVPALELSEW